MYGDAPAQLTPLPFTSNNTITCVVDKGEAPSGNVDLHRIVMNCELAVVLIERRKAK